MDPLWTEIAKLAPGWVVLAGIVVVFLRHIKEEREVQRAYDRERADALTKVLDRNSAALDASSTALGRALYVVDRHEAMNGSGRQGSRDKSQ